MSYLKLLGLSGVRSYVIRLYNFNNIILLYT